MSQAYIEQLVVPIFNDTPKKIKLLNTALKLVNRIIDSNSAITVDDDIKKIIKDFESKKSVTFDIISIIPIIPNIIRNFYVYLETIKKTILATNDRKFIKANTDLVTQIFIIITLQELIVKKYIDEDSVVKILKAFKSVFSLKLDMSKPFKLFC